MKQIVHWGRHTGFTSGGVPVVTHLTSVDCADAKPDFLHSRHVAYTSGGFPVSAWAWVCCDGFCPDGTVDCYVQPDCWPVGPGPGISRTLVGYLTDVNSCPSADGVEITFIYDDVSGTWVGSDVLGGHTYTYAISCGVGSPGDPGKFDLSVSVDGSPAVHIGSGGATCTDPITMLFAQLPGDGCRCGDTDTPAELNLTVRGNCRKTTFARHVGYTTGGKPIVAREVGCFFGPHPTGCWLTCGLSAVITADPTSGGDCVCLGGTYALAYSAGGGSGEWDYIGGFPCPGSPGTLNMNCGPDPDHPGKLCFTMSIVCAVDVTATSKVCNIDPADVDTLDITFDFAIDNTATPCSGGCTYTWIEMATSWSLGDTCDPPECGPCPNAPVSPPADPTDGQVYTEPCPNTIAAQCCKGTIHVRVTR